jgi:arginine/lysine/histidine transport system ATP-binding protein
MLEIKNLRKVYSDGTVGVDDVSVEVPREHIFAILGTSGAGKTTLLQCLGRFLQPTSGAILLNGRNIAQIPMREFRRQLGIVFQELHLFPHLTILENLTLAPVKVYGLTHKDAEDKARQALNQLGIAQLERSYPSAISGGQAQRVAIARALVLEPDYLLLDEPTSALDINTTREFADWLVQLKAKTTFIIVTHDLPFAKQTAHHAILMEGGRVAARGTVEEIARNWAGGEPDDTGGGI